MNWTLFKADLKSNWFLLILIALVLLMYGSISVSMFDPESAEAINAMLSLLPEGMIKAFGFTDLGTDLTQYVTSYMYGFIMILFPLIYIVATTNNIMARHIDSGSMAYLLTTPNSRVKIAATQAFYLLKAIAFLCGFLMVVLMVICESMFPGMLKIGKFILLNLATYLVLTSMAGVGFLAACSLNETRWSLAVGAGVPLAFFLMDMFGSLNESLAWVADISIYTLMDASRIINGTSGELAVSLIVPGVLTIGLFVGGIVIFKKRSLTI